MPDKMCAARLCSMSRTAATAATAAVPPPALTYTLTYTLSHVRSHDKRVRNDNAQRTVLIGGGNLVPDQEDEREREGGKGREEAVLHCFLSMESGIVSCCRQRARDADVDVDVALPFRSPAASDDPGPCFQETTST